MFEHIPDNLIEKIEDYMIEMYKLEHQTKFKILLINKLHDYYIEHKVGQYKELIENLPKTNVGFGYYCSLIKDIIDLRFKHIE